jgi:sugar lactone lactonase YvrE
MNDATADPAGRFWAGSMRYDNAPDAGSLYRVDHSGTITRVLDGVTIPNGPAFSPDGRTMYLADSDRGIVRRYAVDPATGDLAEPETFFSVSEGSPDGMAVDRDGFVWSAVWGAGEVRRHGPDGTLDRVVPVPAAQPAGLCLGGPEGRTLYITSATDGLDHPGPQDGAVFTLEVEVPGRPADGFRPAPGWRG